jgi:hypothetical protein
MSSCIDSSNDGLGGNPVSPIRFGGLMEHGSHYKKTEKLGIVWRYEVFPFFFFTCQAKPSASASEAADAPPASEPATLTASLFQPARPRIRTAGLPQ